jgi:hypothetical protein
LQTEIIKAVQVVKANYLVLDRLKEGSPAERKLAEAAVSAIQRFNQVIENANRAPDTMGSRFTRFLFEKAGLSVDPDLVQHTIDLPLSTYIRMHAPRPDTVSHSFRPVTSSETLVVSQKKVSALVSPLVPGFQPTARERDVFRLKAIMLMQEDGDFARSNWNDIIKMVGRAPIQSASEVPPGDNASAYHGVVTFRQTLQPFPGEFVVLEGSFQRNAHSPVTSVPIPPSFRLSSKSVQTGFPHPSQYNGWALCDTLLPTHGLMLEDLHRRKRQLAQQLLPDGKLNLKGKECLRLKKVAFEQYIDRFLSLHQQLAETILSAVQKKYSKALVQNFFTYLYQQEDPYDMLSLTYQVINENFILQPFTMGEGQADLEQTFLKQVKRAQRQAERPKHPGMLPGVVLGYTALMGPLFGEIAWGIIQQHLVAQPRPLTDVEKRFQNALYRQLSAFLEELEGEGSIDYEKALETSLKQDIRCFEGVVVEG